MAEKLESIIEALLFTTDKPIPDNVLAEITETTTDKIKEAIDRINIRLKENGSAIMIRQIAGGYEFLTLPEYAGYIKKLYKNRFLARLSKPAMEVLAIIAYKQPITKQEIELIRGVNSDGVFHTLLERKLIKITGRKDSPGRPLIYGTTREFLQYLGINSLDELPRIEEIRNILEKDENIEKWQDRIEGVKSQQSLFEFENEGQSVSKRYEEEKSHTQNVKEVEDMGKKKNWQEEYEELYGEKEEETYETDDDYEITDEDEEDEEKEDMEEEEEENNEEDEEYDEDEYEDEDEDEDEEEEIYEEDFDELEEDEEDEEDEYE